MSSFPVRGRGSGRAFRLALALVVALGCARGDHAARAAAPTELWLWYNVNLADDQSIARMESVWRRAVAAGYRHVMLTDAKFPRLDLMNETYLANLRRVKALAASLGLEVVPTLFPVGRANALLMHDPNLIEGLMVRDAPFEVQGGVARPLTDPPVTIPSKPEFADREVQVANGIATVRDNSAHARFRFALEVAPRRCYHVTVMIRTQDFSGEPKIQALSDDVAIHFPGSLGVKPTQDWTRHDFVFNSLDHDHVVL